ncbi:hypothetical protein BU15DRAFT_73608 [Melanogaster broomeanus]|nr:hypothetical protein BU15DRAFT_73608 [Melanogaster broomeanus]
MAKETVAKGLSEDAADETTDDVSLTAPASRPDKSGKATPIDNTSEVTMNETATPPSMPLEGECDAQRRTNGARTGQQHGAIAHSQGPSAWAERHASCTTSSGSRVPDRIIDDPGRCVEPSPSDRTPAAEAASIPAPPSMLLKGEQGSRRTSGCANEEVHTQSGTKAKTTSRAIKTTAEATRRHTFAMHITYEASEATYPARQSTVPMRPT